MQRQPTVVGLKLCEQAIVQETTRNVTLVNCFRELSFPAFPAQARPFTVCAVLTDGLGEGNLTLNIVSLEDLEEVWTNSWKAKFPHPLRELWFLLPVAACRFPQAGRYQVELAIDREPTAQTILRVLSVCERKMSHAEPQPAADLQQS
jgi:hypothetical protein